MKHIKTYENYNPDIVGKYVICVDTFSKDKRVLDFINSNIGKCIDYVPTGEKTQGYYVVEYSGIPIDLEDDFKNSYVFFEDEILEYSENIEDLEYFLSSNKYNL